MAILTNDELVMLTGFTHGAAQTRWIEQRLGIKALRKANGHPVITWEQINRPVILALGKNPAVLRAGRLRR
jgi:Domain of unknown function (DUF4224)